MKITSHPHYSRWRGIKGRCLDPKNKAYKHYGARGIKICKEWLDNPIKFLNWCDSTYEQGKTLDRKDNSKGYFPSNCKWSSQSEQIKNSRETVRKSIARLNNLKKWYFKIHSERGDPKTRKTKFCSRCNLFKPVENFNKNKAAADGVCAYCTNCEQKYRKKRRHSFTK